MTTNNSGTSLAVVDPNAQALAPRTEVYEPQSIEDAFKLARWLVASKFLPRAITTPEQAFTIILAGKELGLTAMQSLRTIHVIEGKPTLAADLQVALVKRSPTCLYFRLVKSDEKRAEYETQRGDDPEPTRLAFTIEDAQRAQLTGKDNWKKYPAAMLRARCASALARAVYPELVMGVYDPDELEQVARQRRPAAAKADVSGEESIEVAPEMTDTIRSESAEDAAADTMIRECERGFTNWDAKRAWADENKERKAGLPADVRERVSAAFKAAHPKAREKQPEPPPAEEPGTDDAQEATE